PDPIRGTPDGAYSSPVGRPRPPTRDAAAEAAACRPRPSRRSHAEGSAVTSPVRQQEGAIAGVGGAELYRRSRTPTASAPRGLITGSASTAAATTTRPTRSRHVADALPARGYTVAAHDHRGHGRSGGRRGHIDRMDNLVADIGTASDRA